jgi:hypothetical protein
MADSMDRIVSAERASSSSAGAVPPPGGGCSSMGTGAASGIPAGSGAGRDGDPARSAETMRSMLSAMQAGWQRGRQEAAEERAPGSAEAARNPGDQEDDTP